MKALLRGLGFEKQSRYVHDYFYMTNMRASIYMSIVVIVLEIWMIIRMTMQIINYNLQSNFAHYFEKYYSNYLVLLASGVLMLFFAVRYIKVKTKDRAIGYIIKWVFTFVCIYFGIKISMNDYSKG